jgi:hypothetical protein
MADASIANNSADVLVTKLKAHIENDIREKYQLLQKSIKSLNEFKTIRANEFAN